MLPFKKTTLQTICSTVLALHLRQCKHNSCIPIPSCQCQTAVPLPSSTFTPYINIVVLTCIVETGSKYSALGFFILQNTFMMPQPLLRNGIAFDLQHLTSFLETSIQPVMYNSPRAVITSTTAH